jgi:hypothetical protein
VWSFACMWSGVAAGLRLGVGRGVFATLPTGTSAEEKAARDRLFQQFDPNGNGFLSLAEIDKGIRDVLGLEVVCAHGRCGASGTRAHSACGLRQDLFHCKPAIMRAYQAAKGVYKVRRVAPAPFVSHCGLRLFLRRGSD